MIFSANNSLHTFQLWLEEHKIQVSKDANRLFKQRYEHLSHAQTPTITNALKQIHTFKKDAHYNLSHPTSWTITSPLGEEERATLTNALQKLRPWRKGPFNLCSISINSEWRSDWKWRRIAPYLGKLEDQSVLDVGCGNGYMLLRMQEQKPALILGIDPFPLWLFQFDACAPYNPAMRMAPLKLEDLEEIQSPFDWVLCMGVLYHHPHWIDALRTLKAITKKHILIETLVMPDNYGPIKASPYAGMRNIHYISTLKELLAKLREAGFQNPVVAGSASKTSFLEQRRTPWTSSRSLQDFLDLHNPSKTHEGHPGPTRVVVIAHA